MKIFIGMETSGQLRNRFAALGHNVYSADLLPAVDGSKFHMVGDVFQALNHLRAWNWVPDVGVFHPDCTYHTGSAAWAFKDGPYHMKVKPGTLVGQARRDARFAAEQDVERIKALPFRKIVENPVGTISTRTSYGKAADIVQPFEFFDNASKKTCLWAFDAAGNPIPFKLERTDYYPPRLICDDCGSTMPYGNHKCSVCWSHSLKPRWSNQTDKGQNKLAPSDDRWSDRSRTYDGIADAIVKAIA